MHIFLLILPPCTFLIVLEYLFLWVLHVAFCSSIILLKCEFSGIYCLIFLCFNHPFLCCPLPSSSLYQPPRRRPSAVWSPCAATNMGRAAVPAWSASWNKWPGSARPAPAIATYPATATGGGGDGGVNQWSWILTKSLHLMALKSWAAVLTECFSL